MAPRGFDSSISRTIPRTKLWKFVISATLITASLYILIIFFTTYPDLEEISPASRTHSLPNLLTSFKRSQNEYAAPLLRGIDPKNRLRYELAMRKGAFRCLISGEEIAVSHLNDDYCDCQDGTDEPSTSACSYMVKEIYFYCKTKNDMGVGIRHANRIPSAWVDDGICDCCDGSDEKGSLVCKETCSLTGIKWRGGKFPVRSDY